MERLLNTTDDYESINNGNQPNGLASFTDVNFPRSDGLYWNDAGEGSTEVAQTDNMYNLSWMRISDPNFPGKTLWGPNRNHDDIGPEDIVQGYIGNCWIMAAVSALAERDNRITNFMVSDAISPNGIYAVNLYALGVPFTMVLDDWMAMRGNNTIFASVGTDGSVWGALVEKAFAKYYGNYTRTVAGLMADAVSALNGSPAESISHGWLTADNIWDRILEAKREDASDGKVADIVTGGSKNCGSHDNTTANGVACSHAYSILDTHVLTNAAGDVHAKLLKVRNPWGTERYGGPWSDFSEKWDEGDYR